MLLLLKSRALLIRASPLRCSVEIITKAKAHLIVTCMMPLMQAFIKADKGFQTELPRSHQRNASKAQLPQYQNAFLV